MISRRSHCLEYAAKHRVACTGAKNRITQPRGFEFVQVNSILYCKAEGACTKIVFNDKKHSLLISGTLGDIEEMLPMKFYTFTSFDYS